MLSREDNELLTRTGPGTPMGDLVRRYWIPVVESKELAPGGRVKALFVPGSNAEGDKADGKGDGKAKPPKPATN